MHQKAVEDSSAQCSNRFVVAVGVERPNDEIEPRSLGCVEPAILNVGDPGPLVGERQAQFNIAVNTPIGRKSRKAALVQEKTPKQTFMIAVVGCLLATVLAAAQLAAQADVVDLTVRARGATGSEVMQIRLGTTVLEEFTVSTDWQELAFDLPAEAAFDDLAVGFVNNHHDPVDRNAFVDWVELDGERRQGESSSVWSTGKWASDTGCANGPASDEGLLCSGFLHFGGEPNVSTIIVHAAGSTGTENLELQIDGVSVATQRVTTSGMVWSSRVDTGEFRFTLPESVDHGRLRLAFTNDGRSDGDDRNLRIDRVEVDSETYEISDPRVESSGTWRNGAECDRGFFGNRVLACDGWFQIPDGAVASPPPTDPPVDPGPPPTDPPVDPGPPPTAPPAQPIQPPATLLPQVDAPTLDVEVVADQLTNPWGFDFLPTGELLFAERLGRLNLLTDAGVSRVDADFTNLASGTSGLLGLAVDPDFAQNRRFYTCQGQDSPDRQQVVAWQLSPDNSSAGRIENLVDIDRTAAHSGCRLGFDAEGFLLATFGDDFIASTPQDPDSLHGKVLRIDPITGQGHPDNGSIHVDLDDRIYTLGHRNPQGIAFHPTTGAAWISEHGPDIDDEINLLQAGGNYGWDPIGPQGPSFYDELGRTMTDLSIPGAVPAKWRSGEPTVAPGDIEFLAGPQWGDHDGSLVLTTLKDQRLHIFNFDDSGSIVTQAIPNELDNSEFGRLRSAIRGPDGALFLTTSNSGFGNDDLRRDAILRITPAGSDSPPPPPGNGTPPPPVGDTSEIAVVAHGRTGTERLVLEIDGVAVHEWTVATADSVEEYSHDEPVSAGQVRVRFVNNGSLNGVDKDVWIDYITIGDERFESEHPTVRSLGSWANGSRCREGTFNTEFLACNGWFQYADDGGVTAPPVDPGPGDDGVTIEFRALGSTGEERVELQLDGEALEMFDLTTGMATYVYEHDGDDPESIRLEFVNDFFGRGIDRNVRVDFLRVGAETIQTEGSAIHSTGTWDSSTRCSPGNKRSEWLHCAGHFEFR